MNIIANVRESKTPKYAILKVYVLNNEQTVNSVYEGVAKTNFGSRVWLSGFVGAQGVVLSASVSCDACKGSED